MFDYIDESKMQGTIVWEDDECVEFETVFPIEFEVCNRCNGTGKHCHPAIDGNGLTREDFSEDPDFEEAYFRGDYDVPCESCNGLRVEPVVAIEDEQFSDEQKAAMKFVSNRAHWRAEDARTMRMESGEW